MENNTLPVTENGTTAARFQKCVDSRGRAIRGLWVRRNRYYAQMQLPGRGCRRVPLLDAENNPITTVPKAVIARAALLAGVSDLTRRTPVSYSVIEEIVEGFVEGFLPRSTFRSGAACWIILFAI